MAGVITTTQSFANGDSVTSTSLNNIASLSSFSSTDAVANTTLAVVTGKLKVGTITSAEIGTGAVITGSILDAQVTPAKLSSGAISWTSSSTTIGSGVTGTYTINITPARTGDGASTIQIGAQDGGTVNATITRATGKVGVLTFDNLYDITDTTTVTRGQIDFKVNGSSKLSIRQDGTILFGSTPSGLQTGDAPLYGVRAWAKVVGDTFTTITASSAIRSGTTVTITSAAHGFTTGDLVSIYFSTNIVTGMYYVTSATTDTFTITVAAGSGNSTTTTWRKYTITAGGNVKSVTSNELSAFFGLYAVNFTTDMIDSNYSINVTTEEATPRIATISTQTKSARSFAVQVNDDSGSKNSAKFLYISAHR